MLIILDEQRRLSRNMTHRQLPGKVPIILVEQRRLSTKTAQRQLPGKVPNILVEKRRLSKKMTQQQLPGKVPIILVEQRKLSRNDTDSFPDKVSDILLSKGSYAKTTQTAFQARCQSSLLSRRLEGR